MKVLDVKSFQSGIDQTVKDLEGLRAQVEPIQRAIRDFHSLEEDLKGQGGLAIRAFYKDTHEPFLIFLHQSLTDYENLLKEMKEAIESYESHDSGYISQAYIENEVIEGFDKVETKVIELTSDANSIIEKVDDLVSISEINESQVIEDVQAGKRKADEVVEKLNILDEFQASQLEVTQDDIQTMRTLLTEMESKFANGSLSIANYSPDSLKDIDAYNKIKEDIYNRDKKTISTVDIDNIEEMSMSEIKMAHESQLMHLSADNQAALNGALEELEKGNITRKEYLSIMKGLLAVDDNTAEDTPILKNIDTDLLKEEMTNILKTTGLTTFNTLVFTKGFTEFANETRKIADYAMDTYLDGVGKQYNPSSEKQYNAAKKLHTKSFLSRGFSKIGGPVTGFGFGMYDDMSNSNKTVGEAIAHNSASLLAGVGTGVLITAFLGSNPAGWALAGTIALSTAGAYLFEKFVYDKNLFGIKTGLDAVGNKIDDVWEGTKNLASKAGQAVSDTVNALNPMNWAW